MAKAEKNAKSRKSAEYLKKHGRDRTTGNCPLCHNTITNGTVHAIALCKTRRPLDSRRTAKLTRVAA